MDILVWCAAAALLAGVLVFAVTTRGRKALAAELAAAQSTVAVTESRLADLAANHATLDEAHRRVTEAHLVLSSERVRLDTTLEKTAQDLQRESAVAAQLRVSLEEVRSAAARLDSEYRVAKSTSEGLATRVGQLDTAIAAAQEENRNQGESIAGLRAGVATLEQQRDGLVTRLAEQKTWVEEQTRFFEEKITTVTRTLLDDRARTFSDVNKKEMDAVVTPFKEQLKEFRQRVDHIYTADTRERGQLQEQIVQLTSLNQTVSRRAEELTNALTISSKATGDWGEMILHKILEDSGLREGKEYSLQHTVEAEDESLQRPDAVIFLPEDRQVVVDSKVSNKAWKEYCAATDEETRAARLAEHLASLRAHVRGLSARDYPRSPDLKTVDFVLMFVPVEAALLTAFAHDETLYTDAYRAKIILVVPSTLMAVLKLVEGMWLFQKRKESADKIADAGRKLYEKLTVFSDTFVEVGEAIQKAHGTFEKARGQLATGRGNAIKLAQRMVELGVGPAPGKVMAPALAVLAESEDGEEDIEALTVLPAVDGASEIPGEAQG
jgi:DNA recombination protein RmuC